MPSNFLFPNDILQGWYAKSLHGISLLLQVIYCLHTKTKLFMIFFSYYFLSIPERHGPLPQTICSCLVRSELATVEVMKWKPNVPCVAVEEEAAVGRQQAPEPQQVLRGLGQQPRLPWKREEHVGSHASAEHYLRNQRGGTHRRDSNTEWMFDKRWLAVYMVPWWVGVCDSVLTFSRINGHIVVLSEKLPVALMAFTFLYNWKVH